MQAGPGFGCFDQLVFQRTPCLVHLAASDFFGRSIDEAKLADREVLVGVAHGWAKGSALHGAGGVEVAGPGGRIEDRQGSSLAKSSKASSCCGWVKRRPLSASPGNFGVSRAREAAARSRIRLATGGSAPSKASRSCSASSWETGNTPTQHWWQPGLQASQWSERSVADASAASRILNSSATYPLQTFTSEQLIQPYDWSL